MDRRLRLVHASYHLFVGFLLPWDRRTAFEQIAAEDSASCSGTYEEAVAGQDG